MNLSVTLFQRINWTRYGLKTITVDEAIDMIRQGTYLIDDSQRTGVRCTLQEMTYYLQHLPSDADIQDCKIQYLPAVSFNGVYDDGIKVYSNVTAIDFDHIPSQEEYTNLYMRLMSTPCVRNIYRTPSGRGLKALILHDNPDSSMHKNLYEQLLVMFQTPFIKTDSSCKDLSRRNYLCFDPDVWTNPSPKPYHFTYVPSLDPIPQTSRMNPENLDVTGLSDASVMNLLKSRCRRFHPEYLIEGARRNGVYWFGTQSAKAGVECQFGLDYVTHLYLSDEIGLTYGNEFTEKEITDNYMSGYYDEEYDANFRENLKPKK